MVYEYVFSDVKAMTRKKNTQKPKQRQAYERRRKSLRHLRTTVPLPGVCQIVREEAMPIFHARLYQILEDARAECDTRKERHQKALEALAAGPDDLLTRVLELRWRLEDVWMRRDLSKFLAKAKLMRRMVV